VHVVLTDVNDEQLDCTLGMLVSTDCKLEAEPVPFGNRLPVVISSASSTLVAINHLKSKNLLTLTISFFSHIMF
jgi:hypothetical protein